MFVNLPAAVVAAAAAAAEGVLGLELLLLPPVASTRRLIATEDLAGATLQLVHAEPTLPQLLVAPAPLAAAAAAAAVAAAMPAAAGVMPHISGGGLGPCFAL
jgi:hypothetical protein